MGRHPRRQQDDFVEAEAPARRRCHGQVAPVHRIERPSEDARAPAARHGVSSAPRNPAHIASSRASMPSPVTADTRYIGMPQEAR